jgi:hypothetical protein
MRKTIVTFIMKCLFMKGYHVSKNPAKKADRKKADKEAPLQASLSEGREVGL